jgi:uncharacterized protein (TIGR03083 family)
MSDLQQAITAEFVALADVLERLDDSGWDSPSLCAGWRVREVVAHMTMPARYSMEQFQAELQKRDFDFTRLSNDLAEQDAALPTDVLIGNLRDPALHQWQPPGGGQAGALNHVVIHELDITVPLDADRHVPEPTIRSVLDNLTAGGTHEHFGFDLDDLQLQATDIDWTYGSGALASGTAEDLALFICGRTLPDGRISR